MTSVPATALGRVSTRNQLLDSAFGLVIQQGWSWVTMGKLASPWSTGRATS